MTNCNHEHGLILTCRHGVDMFTWGCIVLSLPKRAHVDWNWPILTYLILFALYVAHKAVTNEEKCCLSDAQRWTWLQVQPTSLISFSTVVAEKISKNRLVCKDAVALVYYRSCWLLVMCSWCDTKLKLVHVCFPALVAGHVYLRLVFVGSLCRLSLLRLAVVGSKAALYWMLSPLNQVKPVINEFLTSVVAAASVVVWVLYLIRKDHDKRSSAK